MLHRCYWQNSQTERPSQFAQEAPQTGAQSHCRKNAVPAFGRLQVDVKDLSDLPSYRPLIDVGWPRYQFTARPVPEGALWLAFSHLNDSTYGLLFADRLLAHFQRCGVNLRQLIVQIDNGSEFGGNWNRRHSLPPFSRLVEQKWNCRQRRFNPPHRSTFNSDVEAVHGIMEPEFYDLERFRGTVSNFLNQAWAYQLYFNLVRKTPPRTTKLPSNCVRPACPTSPPKSSSYRPSCYHHFRLTGWITMYLDLSSGSQDSFRFFSDDPKGRRPSGLLRTLGRDGNLFSHQKPPPNRPLFGGMRVVMSGRKASVCLAHRLPPARLAAVQTRIRHHRPWPMKGFKI